MSAEPGHTNSCAICGKVYRRKAHLSRHEATHKELGQYKCSFCAKAFSRSDVCRKHCTKCPARGSQECLPTIGRGRRPRACEDCSRSKLSCDRGEPCGRCRSRRRLCSYRRPLSPIGRESASRLASHMKPNNIGNGKPDASFFLKLTNASAATMLESFTDDDIPDIANTAFDGVAHSSVREDDFSLWDLGSAFGLERLELHPVDSTDVPASIVSTAPIFHSGASKMLEAKSKTIIKELHDLHVFLVASDHSYDEAFDTGTASSAFSAQNMIGFAAAYFQLSHSYVSIVHRPSFGSDGTALSLLLAVALAGSMRSPPHDDALRARSFIRLLEEYTFRTLAAVVSTNVTAPYTTDVLEAFQAAIIVSNIQFMANVVTTRRRIRTHRIPVLVSTMRQLGLANMRHLSHPGWYEFVQTESCIRIAHWTAMADWHVSGMFHMPPLVSVLEMMGDMPCPLDVWDACDDVEFGTRAQWPLRPRLGRSVRDCTRILLQDQSAGAKFCHLAYLSMSDLQLIVMGLICCIISANLMSTISTSAESLLRALSVWEDLWAHTTSTMSKEDVKAGGMERYSDEQCFVAKKIIEALLSGRELPLYLQKVGHDTLVELHSFLL